MNTFSNQVSRISRFSRAKVAIAAAAIALSAAFSPASPAAAAPMAVPSAQPSQFVASIPLGPLTIFHMQSYCWSAWHTFSIYKVGLNWRCNRPVGLDPVVNYNVACKKAYNKPTAFAGAPNGAGMRRCFKPLPLIAP